METHAGLITNTPPPNDTRAVDVDVIPYVKVILSKYDSNCSLTESVFLPSYFAEIWY